MEPEFKKKKKPRFSLLLRIGLILLFSVAITSLFVLFTSKFYFRRMAAVETKTTFLAGVTGAIELLDIDNIEDQLKDEAFREDLTASYREICIQSEMEYLLLYTVDSDENKHYLISAGSTADLHNKVSAARGYGTEIDVPLREDQIKCLSGKAVAAMTYLTDEYNCVWTAPVYDNNGKVWGLISAVYSVDHVIDMMNHYRTFIITTVALIVGIALVLAMVFLKAFVFRPIEELAENMKLFSQNMKMVHVISDVPFSDEITDIEESFNKMVSDITGYMEDIKHLTEENVQNETQLEVARKIQKGVVHYKYGIVRPQFNTFGCTRPVTEVGGDFYDIFFLDDKRLCMIMGDVSGKGVTAALFMMIVKYAIKEKIKAGIGLADAMNQTNSDVCESNPECMFATVFAAVLDIETGELKFSNAGHNAPFILSDSARELDVDEGIAIGLFDDIEIIEESITLKPSEVLFIYTDGVTDDVNTSGEQFGIERLRSLMEEISKERDKVSAEDCCKKVVDKVLDFSKDANQFDDISCLALSYSCGKSGNIELEMNLDSFDKVKKLILENVTDQDIAKRIILACEEMFVNIVNYSGAGEVSFSFNFSDERLSVSLIDDGKKFDPSEYCGNIEEFEKLDEGGMGISLARINSEEFSYERVERRNVLSMSFLI